MSNMEVFTLHEILDNFGYLTSIIYTSKVVREATYNNNKKKSNIIDSCFINTN